MRHLTISVLTLLALNACAPVGSQVEQQDLSSQSTSPTLPATPESAPVPRPSSAANVRVCAPKATVTGLDVSDYDSNTQWNKVAVTGAKFAIIKATEGITFVNDQFASDWKNAPAQGFVRGAYHFFHPSDDPVKQAQAFLKTVGTLEASDLPAILDWEVTDGVSSAKQIQNALVWLQLVEAATDKTPLLYVGPAFWNSLGNPATFLRFPLYIANYGESCPSIPPPWSTWNFWQYKLAPLSGVQNTLADLDVFNGTLSQLSAFASRTK